VRREIARCAVVATLVALTEWVDSLSGAAPCDYAENVPLRRWATHRLSHWHERFKRAKQVALKGDKKRPKPVLKNGRHNASPERQHRARILAKRMRHAVETLGYLLPVKQSRRWRQQAADLQASLGAARDMLQAHALAEDVGAGQDILVFLPRLADRGADQSS
jgi:CHAD domain-containing protein